MISQVYINSGKKRGARVFSIVIGYTFMFHEPPRSAFLAFIYITQRVRSTYKFFLILEQFLFYNVIFISGSKFFSRFLRLNFWFRRRLASFFSLSFGIFVRRHLLEFNDGESDKRIRRWLRRRFEKPSISGRDIKSGRGAVRRI